MRDKYFLEYVLGIHIGHDATAALIDGDGNILSAIAEERLSRIKYHYGFPFRAISQCLKTAGVKSDDIDVTVVPTKSLSVAPDYFIEEVMSESGGRVDFSQAGISYGKRELKNILLSRMGKTKPGRNDFYSILNHNLEILGLSHTKKVFLDHHLCHAASAYFTSGWQSDVLVVTIDGSGDGLCSGIYKGHEGMLEKLGETPQMYSPGYVYSAVTKLLGFKRNRHEGKITGLAAYGDSLRCYDIFSSILHFDRNALRFNYDLNGKYSLERYYHTLSALLQGIPITNSIQGAMLAHIKGTLHQFTREDIAAGLQKALEKAVVECVSNYCRNTGISKVALAGGVFANVKVNQRILEIPEVSEVFIHPNMGDAGLALGGPLHFISTELQGKGSTLKPKKISNVYWGPEYSDKEIQKAIQNQSMPAKHYDNLEVEIAKAVAEKRIVGRFEGRMEYGPRALGNRSILADPTDKGINDWLNKRLQRTEFMPFAPSVLEEKAAEVFVNYSNGAYPAEFMTVTFDIKEPYLEKAAGVIHVDSTARPHVVSERQNLSYYRILREYQKLTGLPLLVNTSFNLHEEPIVCTPEDALRSFRNGCVDVLAMGHWLMQ